MASLVTTSLLLLALSLSSISAFHCHHPVSRPPTGNSVAMQRLLPQRTTSSFSILFAEVDEGSENSVTDSQGDRSTLKAAKKCPDCDLCDGSGRILGGIGTVLEWWPIKAYRPCPNLIERGGRYDRAGQGLDEIAFGRDSTFQAGE